MILLAVLLGSGLGMLWRITPFLRGQQLPIGGILNLLAVLGIYWIMRDEIRDRVK